MTNPDIDSNQVNTSGPNELLMQFMAQGSTSMIQRIGVNDRVTNNSNWINSGGFRTSYGNGYNNSSIPANSLPENFDFDMFIQFTRSPTAEKRESAAKAAAMALDRIGHQDDTDMNHYIEALEELLSDFEDVQTMILDKIYTIFNTTQKTFPELWEQLNQRIPKLFIKALRFSSQTQNSAINAIAKLIDENLLIQGVIQFVIVPSLFDFVADFKAFQSEDPGAYEQWFANRVQVASILCKIASSSAFYPKRWVYNDFLPRYSALFMDKNCVIRKLAISAMGTLSKLFGHDFTEKGLVPHLVMAIEDENYRVKKLCCDVFVDVAKNCSCQVRGEILTPKFLMLMNDNNKNVYYSAMQQLGPFIATFADPKKTGVEIRDGRVIRVRTISGSSRKSSESGSINLNASKISLNSITSQSPIKAYDAADDDYSVLPKGYRLPGEFEMAEEKVPSIHGHEDFNSTGDTIPDSFGETSDDQLEDFNKSFADAEEDLQVDNDSQQESPKTNRQPKEPSDYPPSMVFELTDKNLKIHEENFVEYMEEIKCQKQEKTQETTLEQEFKVISLEEKKAVELTVDAVLASVERSSLSPNSTAASTRYWSFESSNFDLSSDLEAYERSKPKPETPIMINTTSASNGVVIPKLNLELDISDSSTSPEKQPLEDISPKVASPMDSSFWQRRFDLLKDSVQDFVRKKKPKSLSPEPKSSVGEQSQKTPVRRVSTQQQQVSPGSGGGGQKHLTTVTEDEGEGGKDGSPSQSASSSLTQSLSSSLSFIRAKARIPPLTQLRDTQKSSPPPPTSTQRFSTGSEWSWNEYGETRKRSSSSNSLGPYGSILSATLTEEERQYVRKNKQDIIPHALLDCLLGIEVSYDIEQQEIVQNLAMNFPAIVFTLGQRNWVYLKGFYQKMANHFMLPVRATLARSMHEIAQIIGSELTDKDLVPIFENFLKDEYEVQLGLLRHLYDFYKMVSPSIREHLASQLGAFIGVEGSRNWRLRHDLAEQCIRLCRLYNASQINDYISCYAMTFANDTFAEVRKKGVELLAEVLSIFIRDEWTSEHHKPMPLTDSLLNDAKRSFFKTTSWRRRQSWCHVLETIIRKNLLTIDQFFEFFANDLLALAKDPINHVRLAFCQVMKVVDVQNERCQELRVVLQQMEGQEDDMEIHVQARLALRKASPRDADIDLSGYGELMKRREERMWHAIHEYQRVTFGIDFEKRDTKSEGSPSHGRNPNLPLDFKMKTYVSLAEPEPEALDFEDELELEQEYRSVPSTSTNQQTSSTKQDSTKKIPEVTETQASTQNLNEAMRKLLAEHNTSEEEFLEFIQKNGKLQEVPDVKISLEPTQNSENLTNLVHEHKQDLETNPDSPKKEAGREKTMELQSETVQEPQNETEDIPENFQINVDSDSLSTDDQSVPACPQSPTTKSPQKTQDLGSEV